MRISRAKLLQAFVDKPAVADKLARAIDALGTGKAKNDGVLSVSEIEAALLKVKSDGVDGRTLHDGFKALFGADVLTAIPDAGTFVQRVLTEQSAQGITEADLVADLKVLTKDPVPSTREAASPTYAKAAEWVAKQLKDAGVEPLGDQGTFFQAFRWQQRFEDEISKTSNVVGRIEGTGPEPRETVVLIAHLDNLSSGEKDWYAKNEGRKFPTYEGANDNTASVAAVLEVTRALQEAGANRRDIIIFIPSAEEEGLKGTEAFVRAPPVPLDQMVGVVNLEMIGRNTTDQLLVYGGNDDQEAAKNPLYARALKVAAQSETLVRAGAQNDDGEGWYRRSDHLVTANAGIPSIMFHGRTAEGTYHTADDTLENLNLEKVRVTARQVFRLVRDLANDPSAKEKRGPAKAELNPFPGRVFPWGD